jgi:hypothetical protein
LLGIVAGGSALLAVGTSRVKEWAVMTDELLYAKLASHIGHTGSPLPTLHGDHVGFLGIVYPILLSPLYGSLDPVAAFDAAHILNAVLFASAAIPAYLLGRRLMPIAWALAVAALVVAVPWSVGASFVMSEAAAYPAFLWAVLGCHLALTKPSRRHDLLAIGSLALAFFTRPQFLFLAAVLPLAALLIAGPRRSLAQHRLLAVAYGLAIVVVIPLAAVGQADRLLGDYGVTATEGSLLPAIAWKSAAIHLDVLAVGLGVIPFVLGSAWVYSSLRSPTLGLRAFAALTAFALPLLALEVGSYDVRFGGPDVVRDRYLFYLAPLLLLAVVASLQEERLPLVGIAAATIFFAATSAFADFAPAPGLWIDSPHAVLNGVIHDHSAGLPAGVFVALCGVLLGVISLGLAWFPRPTVMLALTLAIFAFGGSVAGYAFHRLLSSNSAAGLPITGESRVRDWIDRVTASDVAIVAAPISRDWDYSAVRWWEIEFWNDAVDDAFVTPYGTFTYTPFPSHPMRLDFATGRFLGTYSAPPYVAEAEWDPRFALAGPQVAANVGVRVIAAERPYRALWATRGLYSDGWTHPGRPATLRVYADPGKGSEEVHIAVNVASPAEAPRAVHYRLADVARSINPGEVIGSDIERCMPASSHVDLPLVSDRAATAIGPPLGPKPGPPREVGVVLSTVRITSDGTGCNP